MSDPSTIRRLTVYQTDIVLLSPANQSAVVARVAQKTRQRAQDLQIKAELSQSVNLSQWRVSVFLRKASATDPLKSHKVDVPAVVAAFVALTCA
jgi:hypothetical protein